MPKFDFFDASQTICSLKFGTAPGTRAMPPKKKKKDDGPVEEVCPEGMDPDYFALTQVSPPIHLHSLRTPHP